jgi:hypothetical protein
MAGESIAATGAQAGGDGGTRHTLALAIISLSIVGISLASGLAIGFAGKDRADTTRLIFTSVLPLFGTWVGTVLAFYFARENLQAATESTLRLGARVEPRTPVQQVMIPKAQMLSYDLKTGEDPKTVRLSDLYSRMQAVGRHRIPIFDSAGSVVYVVHDSTITAFADSVNKKPDDSAFTETIGDLLGKAEIGDVIGAIGIVGVDANLADARAAMRTVDGCNDVFVTTTGKRSDPVVGWLTNTDLAGLE